MSWMVVVRANVVPPGRVVVVFARLAGCSSATGVAAAYREVREGFNSDIRPLSLPAVVCGRRAPAVRVARSAAQGKGEQPGWNRLGRQR